MKLYSTILDIFLVRIITPSPITIRVKRLSRSLKCVPSKLRVLENVECKMTAPISTRPRTSHTQKSCLAGFSDETNATIRYTTAGSRCSAVASINEFRLRRWCLAWKRTRPYWIARTRRENIKNKPSEMSVYLSMSSGFTLTSCSEDWLDELVLAE